ncbi:hypothetical protein MMC30_006391 [Trapelia coarctata]|nr:hypothetical protein [Trapelia coarctata]
MPENSPPANALAARERSGGEKKPDNLKAQIAGVPRRVTVKLLDLIIKVFYD